MEMQGEHGLIITNNETRCFFFTHHVNLPTIFTPWFHFLYAFLALLLTHILFFSQTHCLNCWFAIFVNPHGDRERKVLQTSIVTAWRETKMGSRRCDSTEGVIKQTGTKKVMFLRMRYIFFLHWKSKKPMIASHVFKGVFLMVKNCIQYRRLELVQLMLDTMTLFIQYAQFF